MRVGELKLREREKCARETERDAAIHANPGAPHSHIPREAFKHRHALRTEWIPVAVGGCLAKGSFWKGSPIGKWTEKETNKKNNKKERENSVATGRQTSKPCHHISQPREEPNTSSNMTSA